MRKLLVFFTGSPAANNGSGVYANEYLRNGQTENGGLCCSQFVTRRVLYRRTAKKLFVSTVILASTCSLYAQMPPYYSAPYFHRFEATNFSANIEFAFAKFYTPTILNNEVDISTNLQGFNFNKTVKVPSITTQFIEVERYINIHSNYTNNTNNGRLFHVSSDYHPHMLTICYNGEVGIGMDPAFYAAKLSVKGSIVIHDGDLGINGGRIGMKNDKLTFSAQNGFHFNGSTRVEGQLRIGMSHLAFSHSSGEGAINFGNVTNKSCPRPDTMGNLWFRSLPEAGNINTFNQLMILTYKGTLGINTWEPPKNDVNLKLYVSGNVLIKGDAWSNRGLLTSDERLKTDIRPLTIEEKDKLYLLEGKFYNKIIQIEDNTNLVENIVDSVIYNGIDTCGIVQIRTITENPKQIFHITEYGYLAQELMAVFPDLVSQDAEGYYGVNYIGLIPVIVEAMKDQKNTIETQQTEIGMLQQVVLGQELDLTELYELREIVYQLSKTVGNLNEKVNIQNHIIEELRKVILICCEKTVDDLRQQDTTLLDSNSYNNHKSNNNYNDTTNTQNSTPNEPILYQNIPNPFFSNTEISCEIPASFNSAFIYVYNLQGAELMSFSITQTGYNTVTVYGSSLPAGMYLYTLEFKLI